MADHLMEALRAGGEALDRGERGPGVEIALLRDAGWLIAALPVADGGRGWGTDPAGAAPIRDALIALGDANLPIARLYEGHVNALRLVARHGDEGQRERIAAAVTAGAMLGVWGADSDRPVVIADDATLAGGKAFASGLGDLAFAIVTARDAGGLQMVLVAADDPVRADHAGWDVDGMVGSRSGGFDCTGLPAAAAHRLGQPDALFGEPDFHGGVWRLAACHAGAMARLAALSAAWLTQRGAHEAPQMKARLGQVAIESATARLWVDHAALTVETGSDADGAVGAALFAREAVEQAAARLLATVERLVGTAMHRRGSEIGRVARDLRFYLRQADLDGKLALATSHWLGDRARVERAAPPGINAVQPIPAAKGYPMSIKGEIKEAAGFVKEEAFEHGDSAAAKKTAQEGRDLRNEGRVEDGKAPKTTEPGTGH